MGNPYSAAIFNLENTENAVSHDINFPAEDENFRISGLYDIKAACNGIFEVIMTTRGCNDVERNVVLESVPIAWPNANNQLYRNNNITNRDPRSLDVFFANRGSGKASRGTLSFRLMCNPGSIDVSGTNAVRTLLLANIRVAPYPRECQPRCGDNILINGDFSHPRFLTGWTPQAWTYWGAAPSDSELERSARPEPNNVMSPANSPALRIVSLTHQYSQTVHLAPGASYELSGDWALPSYDEVQLQINTPVYSDNTTTVDNEHFDAITTWFGWGNDCNCFRSDGRWRASRPRQFQTPSNLQYKQSALVFRAWSMRGPGAGSNAPENALVDNLRLVRTDCLSFNANESPPTVVVPACPSDRDPISTFTVTTTSSRTPTPTDPIREQSNAGSTVRGSAAIAGGIVAAGLAANML
ncbi:hypothetical protein BKA69DRAFT_1036016 [Paraphysoderma sedebokerense]|nr:hypothetical protein BKA69DRAFT_1036016 [Paraphysoderma sedebokerense]